MENLWQQSEVFLVALYELKIQVKPVPLQKFRVAHEPPDNLDNFHGNKKGAARESTVLCDNVAHITKSVTFSQENLRRRPFFLVHRTVGDGAIGNVSINAGNEAPSYDVQAYRDHAKEYRFVFSPEPSRVPPYTLEFDVHKGFDYGFQDVHFHMHQDAHYGRILVELDLREYVQPLRRLNRDPVAYYHPEDPEAHNLCVLRHLDHVLSPSVANRTLGFWRWEVTNVAQGVIDLLWEAQPGDSDSTDSLEDGPLLNQRTEILLNGRKTLLKYCKIFILMMAAWDKLHGGTDRERHDLITLGLLAEKATEINIEHNFNVGMDEVRSLSQSTLNRVLDTLEDVMRVKAFLGESPVQLFHRKAGKPTDGIYPLEDARRLTEMLLPCLHRVQTELVRRSQVSNIS